MEIRSVSLGSLATNCYLFTWKAATVLVDPAEDTDRLKALLLGQPVDFVVATHGHFDHTGGLFSVPEAAVCIHAADVPYVDRDDPTHPPFDRLLVDGESLAPGIEIIHMPGHSPGSILLKVERVLFVGDLLFAGSIGRTDFPGGSNEDMRRSLERLIALPGDYTLYPGHGPATTLERERRSNPFLVGLG